MNYTNKLKLFLNGMYEISNEGDFESFFYKSKIHVMINLTIATQNLTGEEICNNLCPKYASRTTVLSILKNGTNNNFFEKGHLNNNKKNKIYKLSASVNKKMEKWVYRQLQIFQN